MVRPTCQGLLLSVMHSVAFAEYIQMHVDKSIFGSLSVSPPLRLIIGLWIARHSWYPED